MDTLIKAAPIGGQDFDADHARRQSIGGFGKNIGQSLAQTLNALCGKLQIRQTFLQTAGAARRSYLCP